MTGEAIPLRRRDEPALDEALRLAASFGRLSDGDVRALRRAQRQRLIGGAVAALVVTVGTGLATTGALDRRPILTAHLETQRGEHATVRLKDGSTLRLDGATAIDVALADDRRAVTLRHGAAFFDVAHQAERPFRVATGEVQVTVLGTAFRLDRAAGSDVALAVYRGRVRFGGSGGSTGIDVPAGFRSRAEGRSIGAPARFDRAAGSGDWIDTDTMRLRDLVAVLNRRSGPVIAPPTARLADLALSGRFRLDRARDLLDAVGVAGGFTVRDQDGVLHLEPAAPPYR